MFWRLNDWGINLQERETNRSRHTYCSQSLFLRYGSFKKVMPSRAAQGYGTSGVNGCREASWSEQLDGTELRGALGNERDQGPRASPFSGHRLHGQPTLLHLLQCGMLISKCSPCTAAVVYQVPEWSSR